MDEGIVPLVDALNELPFIWTIDSCQDRGDGWASVYFGVEGSPEHFAEELSAAVENLDDELVRLKLDYPQGLRRREAKTFELIVASDYVSDVARAVEQLAHTSP